MLLGNFPPRGLKKLTRFYFPPAPGMILSLPSSPSEGCHHRFPQWACVSSLRSGHCPPPVSGFCSPGVTDLPVGWLSVIPRFAFPKEDLRMLSPLTVSVLDNVCAFRRTEFADGTLPKLKSLHSYFRNWHYVSCWSFSPFSIHLLVSKAYAYLLVSLALFLRKVCRVYTWHLGRASFSRITRLSPLLCGLLALILSLPGCLSAVTVILFMWSCRNSHYGRCNFQIYLPCS